MSIKKIFILSFGTNAQGQGGDKYYFSTFNKAKKALLKLANESKLKLEWNNNRQYNFINSSDDTEHADIEEIQLDWN